MKDLISIVVPVYNVKQYLEKCIDSILNQTYNNFELILVDDGSKDGSEKICDRYLKKDKRVSVIHKKNGGLSSARNVAIEASKGKYITFIDSDDYVSNIFIETLYKTATKTKADLVISGLKNYYEDDIVIEDDISKNNCEVISKEETYERMFLQKGIDVNATAKLYLTSLFDEIRYPEGKLYEDIQIIDKIIEKTKKIAVISYRGYYYLQRRNSIMYGKMSEERMILISKVDELLQFISDKYPNIVDSIIKRYVYCNYHLLGRSILDSKYKYLSKQLKNNIMKYRKKILSKNIFSKKEKIATIVLSMGLGCYKIFWKLYCRISNKKI